MAFPMNTDLHQMTATMHIYSMHFSQYKPAVMEDSCVCVQAWMKKEAMSTPCKPLTLPRFDQLAPGNLDNIL